MPREKPLRLALLPTLDSLEDKAFAGETFLIQPFSKENIRNYGFLLEKQVHTGPRTPSNLSWFHYIGNLVWVPFGHLFLLSQVIISLQSPQI